MLKNTVKNKILTDDLKLIANVSDKVHASFDNDFNFFLNGRKCCIKDTLTSHARAWLSARASKSILHTREYMVI